MTVLVLIVSRLNLRTGFAAAFASFPDLNITPCPMILAI
jgi:hypothetical protein